MSPSRSTTRVAGAAALLLALASGCGGRSFTQDEDKPGGAGRGGALGAAGKPGQAGQSNGGATSSGAAASAGASYAGEGCTAPPVSGECEAYFQAWHHDPSSGICRPFIYGGCGGNENRYGSLEECQRACSGGSPDYDACSAPSDCIVTGAGCCGVCDHAGLSAHDLVAYGRNFRAQVQCSLLRDAAPGEAPACAPCPPVRDGTLRYFVPDCVRGQCSVVDLRSSPLSACTRDEDCRARSGNDCCEDCSAESLIAVRTDGSFEKLVCEGRGPVACDDCVPPSSGARAYCAPGGHCEVGYPVESD